MEGEKTSWCRHKADTIEAHGPNVSLIAPECPATYGGSESVNQWRVRAPPRLSLPPLTPPTSQLKGSQKRPSRRTGRKNLDDVRDLRWTAC